MRVLVFGDSNTFGTGPMASLDDDPIMEPGTRWVDHLAAALPGVEVRVEGQPGRTTVHDDPIEGAHRNGLRILPALIESHRPLDVLVICLGTNDLKARFGVGATDVALGMGKLAEVALASGFVGQVLVVVPPVPFEAGALAGVYAGAKARGKGLAPEAVAMGKRVGVEVLPAGALIDCDPLDGVHLGPEAHETLGLLVAEKLKEML